MMIADKRQLRGWTIAGRDRRRTRGVPDSVDEMVLLRVVYQAVLLTISVRALR